MLNQLSGMRSADLPFFVVPTIVWCSMAMQLSATSSSTSTSEQRQVKNETFQDEKPSLKSVYESFHKQIQELTRKARNGIQNWYRGKKKSATKTRISPMSATNSKINFRSLKAKLRISSGKSQNFPAIATDILRQKWKPKMALIQSGEEKPVITRARPSIPQIQPRRRGKTIEAGLQQS